MKTVSLPLTQSQLWIVAKAMVYLSSASSERRLRQEFPDMDIDAFAEDVSALATKIEVVNQGFEVKK